MSKQIKKYPLTKFPVSTISKACQHLISLYKLKSIKFQIGDANTNDGRVERHHETLEEFLIDYPNAKSYWLSFKTNSRPSMDFSIWGRSDGTASVSMSSDNERDIASILAIFESNLEKSKIKPSNPMIFIGHGRDEQWRELKNHLQDEHNFKVNAYEVGPRAGLGVKDVLEKMLDESSIAFLVLTGEDIDNCGRLHARQNVVHELGLFQGRLGFDRAIPLVEDGVMDFSNIRGITKIIFSKGNIQATFGKVVATINREFPRD